jgi:hypothetical protein
MPENTKATKCPLDIFMKEGTFDWLAFVVYLGY